MKKASNGSKADNLERLLSAGFNVPKYYVLSSDVKGRLDNATARKELKSTYEKWLKSNNISAVAIRSSSTLEDNLKSSFAGQFKTVLSISDSDDFVDALKSVYLSKQSKAYSHEQGSVSAIVQEFIEPDVSGVIFSINPANGNNEFVINAALGRGTNVVEGKQAQQYFVNRLDSSYSTKKAGASDKTLTKTQVEDLSSITFHIESLFGIPQDIEWAIKDQIIYILQARPITQISHLRLWDSSNLAESFPGIVLPLTFSIAKRGYMYGYKAQAYSAGLSWYELEAEHRTFDSMVGIFNGRMYYNLISWYRFISLFPGSAKNQKFLDVQIATQGEAIYQAPAKQTIAFRLKFILRVVYRTIFFNHELKRFYTRFSKFEDELSRMPQDGDAQLLMQQYTHIEQSIIPHFGRTVDNDFFVMTYHGWLKRLLNRWLPDQEFERSNIIGSIRGVLSAEQAILLYQLAESFKSDKKALDLLRKGDYKALDSCLEETQLQNSIAHYIETFGHRFAEDQKIEAVNPTLEQFGIYRLMRAYVKLDSHEIKQRLENSTSVSRSIEDLIETKLRLRQRMMYRLLLGRLKHHLRLREKNRLLRGKVYGYLRELFPKVGQALVDEGVINNKEDIYYLQIEEIYQLMQAALITNDLPSRIEKRREAYTQFSKIDMPERFITKGLPALEKVEAVPTLDRASVKSTIPGLISSPGTVEGRAVILSEPIIPDEPYDIIIARHTDPGWTPLIALAKGVVVEHGGMLSHAAIITRELGIPSIIGVKNASMLIKTGMRVRINTQTSSLEILD
jgi:phosphoenolpyruvate synthase/pyruvate phosphate dikinase